MENDDWTEPDARSIGMYLNGDGIPSSDERGRRILDDSFLLYFNASGDDVPLTLPPEEYAAAWDVEIDTAGREPGAPMAAGASSTLAGRSVLVLRAHTPVPDEPDSSVAASVAASRASRASRADKAG
jgi:glycogen operon protein